jgi:Domain of unknown function (DU1801)
VSNPIDTYFLEKDEPIKGCLLFLREYILNLDDGLSETWKYGMPFYCYRGKMFCYLWVHKKYKQPYLGLVDGGKMNHPMLIQEKRARMKIMLFDPAKDLPVKALRSVLREALRLAN